jgi:hypothetical protein
MRRLHLITPKPSILSAIALLCPTLDQFGEQKSIGASAQQKLATLDRRSQHNLGLVNDQSGGWGGQ